MPNYPELPRGVVAVLLYYDGRKSLVTSLRTLVQARSGNLWTVEMAAPVAVNYINRYTNELVQDGIIAKILSEYLVKRVIGFYVFGKLRSLASLVGNR